MRKIFLFLLTITCSLASQAQGTQKVFGSAFMVWTGLDFSKAKMVGWKDDSPHKIRDEYFKEWNLSVDADLGKTFQKKSVFRDSNPIIKANGNRETEHLVANDDADLTPEAIADAVKQIPVGQKKEGLGVVLEVQSFNKTTSMATVWVTFYDIATHEVLLTKKVTGKAAGGAPIPAWKGAISNILDKIAKTEFSAWKKEANY